MHLLSFYLDNLNLPLTRSNFCFPSDHSFIILPSIIRNVLQSVLKFISTQPCILCQSTSNLMSTPDHEYSSSFVASIPFSKYQVIPRCPWSEVCMILAFLPTHLFISLFSVISFELPITWTFFDFARRFELSGVDYLSFNDWRRYYSPIFTSPEATNCFSIITLMILREN